MAYLMGQQEGEGGLASGGESDYVPDNATADVPTVESDDPTLSGLDTQHVSRYM